MWRKLALSTFLAVLMLHWVVSIPTPTSDDEDSSSNEFQYDFAPNGFTMMAKVNYTGPKYLPTSVISNLTMFMDFQLYKTSQIAKDVLADPKICGVHTAEMLKERRILEKYVKKAAKAFKVQVPPGKSPNEAHTYLTISKGRIIEKFHNFVNERNMTVSNPIRSDTKRVVWETLLQHGLEDYDFVLSNLTNRFYIYLAEDVLFYMGSLSPEDRIKEKNLVELFEMYDRDEKRDKLMFGRHLVEFFTNVYT